MGSNYFKKSRDLFSKVKEVIGEAGIIPLCSISQYLSYRHSTLFFNISIVDFQ